MSSSSSLVRFLYNTVAGRLLLKGIMISHADRLAVTFLRSRLSRCIIAPYARLNGIDLTKEQLQSFRTYRDFFVRTREDNDIDTDPEHLISPCDGWLSAYKISADSSFSIKNSHYRLGDLLQDEALAERYHGGDCLIFRLCASDYHHYCYIDDGYQCKNHMIPGMLHSVQPAACEKYPVYVLNRRSWTLMSTEHFGPVIQTEIGALIVGGIENPREDLRVKRGMEKGHFELAGSTIVLLFEKNRIKLLPDIAAALACGEYRVRLGACIGVQSYADMLSE